MTSDINTKTSTSSANGEIYNLLASEQISFQLAMQRIKERLQKLREEEERANKAFKEAEVTLSECQQELQRLSPSLEQLGKNVFDDPEWSALQNFKISAALNKVSATRAMLSEAEAAKIKRQEQSHTGFWGKIKKVVGDVFDLTEAHKTQLTADYIELGKVIILSEENNTKLNQIAPESLVEKVREISKKQPITEELKQSAKSTLTRIAKEIKSITSIAEKNIDTCINYAEFKQCLEGFDAKVAEDLRLYAELELCLSHDPEIIMLADGLNGQLELLKDRIRIKRLSTNKEILLEHISAITFKDATAPSKVINAAVGIASAAILGEGAGILLSGNNTSHHDGYIQFSFAGNQIINRDLSELDNNENTIKFNYKQNERFKKIKQAIEQKMTTHKTVAKLPSPPSPSFEIEQLEKLASLRDKGILTEEEFQAKKRQILGL